ncbi:MAG: hypothetical protein AAF491_12295 [Verrucomicrobiota bacterium]
MKNLPNMLACLLLLTNALSGADSESETTDSLQTKIAADYPMPEFKPLAEVTTNWTVLPEGWIPEFVQVEADTRYELLLEGQVMGHITGLAGHRAKVLECSNGRLTLTHQPDGSTRVILPLVNTNLPELITDRYENDVKAAREQVLAQRESAMEEAIKAAAKGQDALSLANWKGDPRFRPAAEHLAAGHLKSGILSEAKRWLWRGETMHQGERYDGILVYFEVDTIFGIFPNSMTCLLQDGAVVKWIDSRTGEERD